MTQIEQLTKLTLELKELLEAQQALLSAVPHGRRVSDTTDIKALKGS